MVYFCADDYGISNKSNSRIETCLKSGVLNKVSVLPNGELSDFQALLSGKDVTLSLHLNLVEGFPLSARDDIPLLVNEQGSFQYSFIGLLLMSLSGKRKPLEAQLYKEIRKQLAFWKSQMGDKPVSIDSHQHTHMIPLVFKTLLRAIRDEKLCVDCLRMPKEPLSPYLLSPSLYSQYSLTGLAKQWLLNFLGLINRRKFLKANLKSAYFMGALFSGRLTGDIIEKLLPRYLKIAGKHGRDVEIALHPGYLNDGEPMIDGCRTSFQKFYLSPWRRKEYDTLLTFQLENK